MIKIEVGDVTNAYDEMFASKIQKHIKRIPRTHLLVLRSIHRCYITQEDDSAPTNFSGFKESQVLNVFNTIIGKEMAVDKITIN